MCPIRIFVLVFSFVCLQPLDDDCRGTAAAVANGGHAYLAVLLSQYVNQSGRDAST